MSQKRRLSHDQLSAALRKERFARVLVETGNATRAVVEAGYNPKPKNIERRLYSLRRDPYVQKRIQELMAEKYPVTQRADDLTALIQKAVTLASNTQKLPELLATIQTLAKFAGAGESGQPTVRQHLHIHGAVKDPLALPED